jgi:hypothetical protein
MSNQTPKQISHGGTIWTVAYEFVSEGRAMYALSRTTYYGEPLFCTMPARFCFPV